MNKENVLKLAAHLRTEEAAAKFDLDYWIARPSQPGSIKGVAIGSAIGRCGTVACIAGHATILAQPSMVVDDSYTGGAGRIARDWLGLSASEADDLFEPSKVSYGLVTADIAADVLTHLAETGEIEWPDSVRFF